LPITIVEDLDPVIEVLGALAENWAAIIASLIVPSMATRARALSVTARSISAAAPVRAAAMASTATARKAAAPAAQPAAEPAAPIVKWVGGKTRLLPELLARMPTFNRYYEPFVGGGALFFKVAPARAILNDFNPDLVNVYRTVAKDVEGVIRRLGVYRKHHNEEHYYQLRARWNDERLSWTTIDRAAAFVYLNKTCFNGLWRVNRSGNFNVPMGRYQDPPICAPEALRAAAKVLRSVDEVREGSYVDAVKDAKAGDFLYFDPPYDPVTTTANFTGYTTGSFGPDDQRQLAETARKLVAKGCKVMLSNSDTPFIRSLYKGFRIDRVRCSRAINSNAAKRGDVDEVIVMGEP
jgi:DNA adenine methylase